MVFSKKLEEIKTEVLDSNIKVVSFDLFDTLVLRPCIEPTDLFNIVAKRCQYEGEFVNVRRMAEQYARKKKPFYYDDVTIEEIYHEFAILTDISEKQAYEIMQCELEVEYDYIYPRNSIRELYNLAKDNGKKVIIVTDIYLPKSFIEKVLEKNEINGYDKLYVSSEERLAKGTGRLFQKVIAEYDREGIEKESIIHLGDNQKADVGIGKREGLNTIYLPNAIGVFHSKNLFKPLYEFGKRTDSCYLVGTLANFLFDDPFFPFNINSISGGCEKLFGAALYGPILLAYTKWLMETSIENSIDKILFVMRDGFVIDKIYKMLLSIYDKAPDIDNIYLSRKIRYHFEGKKKNGLLNSFATFPIPEKMTVDEFMEKRLLLNAEEKQLIWKKFQAVGYVDVKSSMGKPIQYYLLMPDLQKLFAKKVEEQIDIIQDYCKEKTKNTHNLAVMDVGYRGSVSRFLHDEMGIKNIGFQMLATPLMQEYVGAGYHIETFYSYSFKCVKELKILHTLTEDIISVQEGTATKIEKNDNEFTIIKQELDRENPIITEIQNGVLEYIQYTVNILKNDFVNFKFDVTIFFDMLFEFLKNPMEIDAAIIRKLSFQESEFIKIDADKNIYEQWFEEKIGKHTIAANNDIQVKDSNEITQNDTEIAEEDRPWEKISKPHLYAIKVCEKLHILNFAIKVKRIIRRKSIAKAKNADIVSSLFKFPMEQSIDIIKQQKFDEDSSKEKILVAGHMTSFDKGICNYLNQLNEHMPEYNFVLMSECTHLNEERTREKIEFPFFIVPQFLGKDRYLTGTGVVCDKKIKEYIDKKDYLRWGVENLIKRHEDMEEDYAYYLAYYGEMFSNTILDIIEPRYVILWNEFFAFHHILKNICQEREIEIIYLEFGSLPGTVSIEKLGQMGESFPGKYPIEFGKLDVSKKEILNTTEILDFLRSSKINRNTQPINNNLEEIKKKLKIGRPTILYAGVNDYESGLVPYTEETKKNHSPIFKSSEDGLLCLKEYAKKNDYNLIYKPHPIIEKQVKLENQYGNSVILALEVDINDVIDVSDVVVTILSQVSYTALIRKKPVVMLGYTQLRGKNCCYEIFSKEDTESVLERSLKEKFTDEMQKNFIRHVAQMNKYNLFDDLQNRSLRYGQDISRAVHYITNSDNSSQEYNEKNFSLY